MTYIGKVFSWIFKPITFPLGWLFKHRCTMIAGTNVCENMFCDVGKRGVEGWTNLNRAGEWSQRPPRRTRPITPPAAPPKLVRYRDGYRYVDFKGDFVDGRVVIKGTKDAQRIDLGEHGSIVVKGNSSVSITITDRDVNRNIRVEGEGEVFVLSSKRR